MPEVNTGLLLYATTLVNATYTQMAADGRISRADVAKYTMKKHAEMATMSTQALAMSLIEELPGTAFFHA